MITTLLRLANAPILPFEFGDFSSTVRRYVEELKKQAGTKVEFQPILTELDKIDASSKVFEDALSKTKSDQLEKVNLIVYQSERTLILDKGLPGRDWYKHQIYAPGLYTGYGAKTLPGVREAIEGSRWDEANREVHDVADVLAHLNARIEEAIRFL